MVEKNTQVTLPRFVSVDDHVVEQPDLWTKRLPKKHQEDAPHVVRKRGHWKKEGSEMVGFIECNGEDGCRWGDQWVVNGVVWPLMAGYVRTKPEVEHLTSDLPVTYDEIEDGCYQQGARLVAMDQNHTEASLCFPTVPRFAGQRFLTAPDKDLALLEVQAFNDWMIEEWCGGAAVGRLIPQTIMPLWDPELAAAEVQRCADLGSHAVAFSECPPHIGLPSIHSGHWDPVLDVCQNTDTVINMHIGTSSRVPTTGPDMPPSVGAALTFKNSVNAAADWLCSGVLERYPRLRIALSEGQVGWLPFLLERLDSIWDRYDQYQLDFRERVPRRPSSYVADRLYACVFDDLVGLANRERIGINQIMFEVDYPHADSTWPRTIEVAESLVKGANLTEDETFRFLRGNAITCYGLERYGLSADAPVAPDAA